MEELLKRLEEIGLPVTEIERVVRYYGNDIDGLSEYVLYMRAMFDDRHEYLAWVQPEPSRPQGGWLRELMEQAPDEGTRQEMQRLIQKMEQR